MAEDHRTDEQRLEDTNDRRARGHDTPFVEALQIKVGNILAQLAERTRNNAALVCGEPVTNYAVCKTCGRAMVWSNTELWAVWMCPACVWTRCEQAERDLAEAQESIHRRAKAYNEQAEELDEARRERDKAYKQRDETMAVTAEALAAARAEVEALREALEVVQSQCAGHADEFSGQVWRIAEAALASPEPTNTPKGVQHAPGCPAYRTGDPLHCTCGLTPLSARPKPNPVCPVCLGTGWQPMKAGNEWIKWPCQRCVACPEPKE